MPVQFPPVIELSDLNGKNGFVIDGIHSGDESGRSVSGAGDINADGVTDLVVGAPGASPNGELSGQSYVLFGGSNVGSTSTIQLSSLNGPNGFAINGIATHDGSGHSVSAAGDINGDGVADLVVGAYRASPNGKYSGQSYVLFGASNVGSAGIVQLSSLNGSDGFAINGISTGDYSGISVSVAGDINADGVTDLVVGAPDDPNGLGYGQSYALFGGRNVGSTGTIQLSSLNGTNGFAINGIAAGDFSGWSVSTAGDINGDGVADLIIGAYHADPNGFQSGQSYVLFGGRNVGSAGMIQLSSLNGSNGFRINGIAPGDYSGISVSTAGDINGDGVADLVVGASDASPNGSASGQSYVLFGGSNVGSTGTIQLSSLNGSNGFAINGIAALYSSGWSVSAAGDINGDGVADLVVGASGASPNGQKSSGQSYVLFGGSNVGSTGAVQLSSLNGANGFAINGIATHDESGVSVSAAGDINADGVADLVVGAYGAPNYSLSGQSYVLFGDSLHLNQNQLSLTQGESIQLTTDNFNITSVNHLPAALIIKVSGIQHGQFSFVTSPNVSVKQFSQQEVIDGQVQFTHDGSLYAPSYNISCSTEIWQRVVNAPATIHFAPLLLVTNFIEIKQGSSIILNTDNFLATDAPNISNEEIIFTVQAIEHGLFAKAPDNYTPVFSFTQADIMNQEIQFITDGSNNPPSFTISVSDGIYTLPFFNSNITFYAAPKLTVNSLSITQGGVVFLTQTTLQATDDNTPASELIFSISALVHGHFQLANNPNVPIREFTQGQVDAVTIQFVQDGSPNAPSYNVSVTDNELLTSPSEAAKVAWTASPAPTSFVQSKSTNELTRNILIGTFASAGALGAIAVCYISMGYLKNARLNAIAKNKSGDEKDYYQHTIIPIAKEIFDTIKITGFMNYISQEKIKEYVAAIAKVVHEMSELGINIDLQDMPAEQKTLLVNQMIVEMKKALDINKQQGATRCSGFFKPQVTPDQIMEQAKAIATSIREALFSGVSDTRINLPAGMESWQMGGKSNQQAGERTPLLSA